MHESDIKQQNGRKWRNSSIYVVKINYFLEFSILHLIYDIGGLFK